VIEFTLHGEPMGWQRGGIRVARTRGGKAFATVYTPAKTRKYQTALAMAAKIAMRGKAPLDGPLKLTVTAFMGVPSSWSAKKRDAALAGVIRPTGKPDFDNFLKQVDALKTIVWADDAQVVDGRLVKLYAEAPRFHVAVEQIEALSPLLSAPLEPSRNSL
jgi:Holliday junction resolvase RusA-like endonuclease